MSHFYPISEDLLFSRQDPSDPRLGELINTQGKAKLAVVGYPDDEGIRLNGGRSGAALGPTEIRRQLYKTTPHPTRLLKSFRDHGDLPVEAKSLTEKHELAQITTYQLLSEPLQVLTLGGGNDYAYPDGAAFLQLNHKLKPLIINVDAHLDVRPIAARGANSGTPFFQLLESGAKFDFLEIAPQAQCNAKAHWQYVMQKGGKILSLEDILCGQVSLTEQVFRTAGDWLLKPRPTFLAIDMDAFCQPYAQGTSAAWPLGLDPLAFQSLLIALLQRLDVRLVGIYETSPPLDLNQTTCRLAAQLAHTYLHHV